MSIMQFDDVRSVSWGRGLALCALSVAVSACSGGGGGGNNNQTATAATTTTNTTTSPITSLTATPSNLEFSKVVVGDVVGGTVVVNNTGETTFDLQLSDLGEGFTLTNTCGSLDPDESCSLQFEFSPTDQRNYSSDPMLAANSEELALTLNGQGQGLNVEIASIDQTCPDNGFDASILVKRSNGESVSGLRTDNVVVYLDGVEVDLTSSPFESVSDRDPVAISILTDLSGSLDGSEAAIADATSIFINSLGYSEGADIDRAALHKFGSEIDFDNSQAFIDADDAGKDALLASLYGDFSESASNSKIWGSTMRVADLVADQLLPKRYIVLLTDGRDNPYDPSTSPTLEQVIEDAISKDVSVFTIGFGDVNPGPLQQLADETGGFFFSDPSAEALDQAFAQISSTFSDQYHIRITNAGAADEFRILIVDDAGREGEDSVSLPVCP